MDAHEEPLILETSKSNIESVDGSGRFMFFQGKLKQLPERFQDL